AINASGPNSSLSQRSLSQLRTGSRMTLTSALTQRVTTASPSQRDACERICCFGQTNEDWLIAPAVTWAGVLESLNSARLSSTDRPSKLSNDRRRKSAARSDATSTVGAAFGSLGFEARSCGRTKKREKGGPAS